MRIWHGKLRRLTHEAGAAPALRGPIGANHPVVQHLQHGGRIVSSYDAPADRMPTWDERRCARGLRDLGADLIVPVGTPEPVGFLAVGPKESGRLFTINDVDFLRAFVQQVVTAVRHAQDDAHPPPARV